jgi:uncharacterized protein (TIGR00290 family)
MKKKTLLSWSSGKDSAWALYKLRQDPAVDLRGMFTVVNRKYSRASMHATRLELLHRQAEMAGLPLQLISLPDPCSNEECDAVVQRFVAEAESQGIESIAFGDLFLEDVRQYRENQLKGTGIDPVFPLWAIPTGELAGEMLASGLEAYVSSVDLKKLPAVFAGRKWSRALLEEITGEIDPCGENGEIHTIVIGGPMFAKSIPVRIGAIVERDGFAFADIIPED